MIEIPEGMIETHVNGLTVYSWPATEPVAAVLPTHLSVLGFRNRFTRQEKIGLEIAALDDPSKTMAQRQAAALVRSYLADVNSATFVDPSRPDTRDGVIALEQAGLLAQGRALEILDAPITELERFKE